MSMSAGPTAPVFSYAQAAKGLTTPVSTSTQPTPRNESPAASEKSAKDRPAPEAVAQSSALKSPALKADLDDKNPLESVGTKAAAPARDDKDTAAVPAPPASSGGASATTGNVTTSTDQDSRSDEPKSSAPSAPSAPTESSDPPLDASAALDRPNHTAGEKKPKDVDDDWEKISVPSMSAEKELKAAPIPVVNIWQQRKEAQEAKLRDLAEQQRNTVATSASASAPQSKLKGAPDDAKRKPAPRESTSGDRHPKPGDTIKPGRKEPPRTAAQQNDKPDMEAPPPVGDAQFWPTPENSNVEERRKSATYEKTEKAESKGASLKSHAKWVPVPFVPTPKFETQLPPSAARRGGRGGGRARDPVGRGAHTGGGLEKPDGPGAMAPPPLPRQSVEQDRGRRTERPRGTRGASVPTSTNRPDSGDDLATSANPATTLAHKDEPGTEKAATGSGLTRQDGVELSSVSQRSRSSSRTTGYGPSRPINGDGADGHDQPLGAWAQFAEQAARSAGTFDKPRGTGNGASRGNGDAGRDRGSARTRDWFRDKSDGAADKVDSWRDREPSADQSTGRESRPERGRGGYRGRGTHSFNPAFGSSHPYSSPLPQNGFEPARSNSHNESRSRQSSQPYQQAPPPMANSRSNPRSQSIPVGMVFPHFYPGIQPVSQGMQPLQTDMQAMAYPSPMQMQPGIMSAMPYNDPLNSYALLSMVMTQVEYYFSIDNLCKDLFLRKNMDGHGWVPLSVIANFKRVKALTEENMTFDTLRYVCQQVKSVEYCLGPDGEDRLRRRDGWRDFVLPVEERFESARHDGVTHAAESADQPPSLEPPSTVDSSYAAALMHGTSQHATSNGVYHQTSPLSYLPGQSADPNLIRGFFAPSFGEDAGDAALPTFSPVSVAAKSPVQSPPLLGRSAVNGHHRQVSRADIEANLFPDENIPNINIRMQPPPLAVQEPVTMIASAGAAGQDEGVGTSASPDPTQAPSLRGGASSPQQLEQFRHVTIGFGTTTPMASDASVVYFDKNGQESHVPPPRPGQYDQTYQSLHDVAMQHHHMGVEGAFEPLFAFWGDFLVDKFNISLYEEFKATAINEAQQGNSSGMAHLVRYYGKVLSGPVAISERLATDLVELSRQEKRDDRPIFQTLRTAWRNGATNMKTIKRLGDALSTDEKSELDKSG